MSVLTVLIVLVALGLLVWVVQSAPMIAQPFKWAIQAVLVVAVAVWLLQWAGACKKSTDCRCAQWLRPTAQNSKRPCANSDI